MYWQRPEKWRAAEAARLKAQLAAQALAVKRAAEGRAEERVKVSMAILKLAKKQAEAGRDEKARERLQEIIDRFPETAAAIEAKQVLEKLRKAK